MLLWFFNSEVECIMKKPQGGLLKPGTLVFRDTIMKLKTDFLSQWKSLASLLPVLVDNFSLLSPLQYFDKRTLANSLRMASVMTGNPPQYTLNLFDMLLWFFNSEVECIMKKPQGGLLKPGTLVFRDTIMKLKTDFLSQWKSLASLLPVLVDNFSLLSPLQYFDKRTLANSLRMASVMTGNPPQYTLNLFDMLLWFFNSEVECIMKKPQGGLLKPGTLVFRDTIMKLKTDFLSQWKSLASLLPVLVDNFSLLSPLQYFDKRTLANSLRMASVMTGNPPQYTLNLFDMLLWFFNSEVECIMKKPQGGLLKPGTLVFRDTIMKLKTDFLSQWKSLASLLPVLVDNFSLLSLLQYFDKRTLANSLQWLLWWQEIHLNTLLIYLTCFCDFLIVTLNVSWRNPKEGY